ncbi:MAG: hypothetical protein HQ500_12015 [Flavobacteriales bacterium]|nr:hypothetical protein [Flavobacteriales bacterium]
MERRSFIKTTAAGIATSLLAPSLGLSNGVLGKASSLQSFYRIPDAMGHIRHGLFQLNPVHQPLLPHWLRLFEPHRFFHDGMEAGGNDLQTFTIKVKEHFITLGHSAAEVHIMEGDDAMTCESQHQSDALTVMRDKHSLLYDGGKERVAIVLKGEAQINGESFSTHEFIVSDEGLNIEQEEGALSVVIHQP